MVLTINIINEKICGDSYLLDFQVIIVEWIWMKISTVIG